MKMKKNTAQSPETAATRRNPCIENVNIKSVVELATPKALHQELPLTAHNRGQAPKNPRITPFKP